MQTATPAFATAVVNQDQNIAYVVTVAFPVSVPSAYGTFTESVISIENDAQVTTSTPEGTLLLAGYPSAQPTIELSGLLNQPVGTVWKETQSVYWLFNPNDSTSPMYRQTRAGLPITIQAGLYDGQSTPELITIFTGTIDTAVCSNGVVTLTCRDNRSTITNQSKLPPVITSPPFNAGLTSQYAIDYLFRHASPAQYYSWPKQRTGCLLAVSMRSSIWPEVGSYASYTQAPGFGVGLYGTALVNTGGAEIVYTLTTAIASTQTSFWIEGFVGPETELIVSNGPQQVVLAYGSGGLVLLVVTASGNAQQNWGVSTSGKHYVAAQVHWSQGSTSLTGTLYFDGASLPISLTAPAARTAATMPFGGVASNLGTNANASVEGFQVTTESAGVPNGSFTPTLLLDPSLNPLTALPDVTGQDAWGTFQDIAAAENGIIGFNETGLAFFKNRYTIDQTVAVRTVQSSKSLLTLDSSEQMSTVATHVQVPVNQLTIAAPSNVWSVATILAIPPLGSLTFTATTQYPVVNVALTDSGFQPDPPFVVAGDTYWRACTTADGSGAAITTGITVTVVQLSATALQVTVTNANTIIAYLSNPPGSVAPEGLPSLVIGGQAVTSTNSLNTTGNTSVGGTLYADAQWPPIGSGGAVSNTQFGEILIQVPVNNWLQDLPTALQFADDLISDLHRPRPLFTNMQIVCDPRLQLVDRVMVSDPDMSQANTDVLLVGIHTSLGNGRWTQAIDSRAFYTPGSWILGDPGYSELGSTTYLLEP